MGNYFHVPILEMMAFNHRTGKGNSGDDSSGMRDGRHPQGDSKHDALFNIPLEPSRRVVRDRVMTASASAYIRLAVNTSMELEDDSESSRGAKARKRKDEQFAHQSYKDRLRTVLGSPTLFSVISTCLLLDAKEDKAPPVTTTTILSMHEAFSCIALLLCNFVLLTASAGEADSNSSSSSSEPTKRGYDARLRNVLRTASVQLFAEALEKEDIDGSLLTRLREQRRSDPKRIDVSSPGDVEGEEVQSKLAQLFETQNIDHEQQEKKASKADMSNDKDFNSAVFDNLYRRYATRKFQALEQGVADLIIAQIVHKKAPSNIGNDPANDEKPENRKWLSRKNLVRAAKIGGVGVAAGALLAVTGGMAAPGIAAGLAALGVGGTALTIVASPPALIALFGVGGGGLSAYKMKRRTDSLSEFTINRERNRNDSVQVEKVGSSSRAHLHTTVCVSGWLRDENDFQRPWGVSLNTIGRLERLQRFFSVVDPSKLNSVEDMLKSYSDKASDAEKDEELWKAFTEALKYEYGKSPDELLPLEDRTMVLSDAESATVREIFAIILEEGGRVSRGASTQQRPPTKTSTVSLDVKSPGNVLRRRSTVEEVDSGIRVWDQKSEYGGDIYTIQWESKILFNMCRTTDNMVKELGKTATKEVIMRTAFATLRAAAVLPSLLLGIAGSLDNNWTLITIRSDIAGVELAKSLLQSTEYRPVQLVGFSFGARVIYSCLQELARHQAIWDEEHATKKKIGSRLAGRTMGGDNKERIEYTREPSSIVQDVVLMGAPIYVSYSKLRLARHMVAGRFVNCYSRKDWILSMMFQYKNTSGLIRGTCGTGPIIGVGNIENSDVASLVGARHSNYCRMIPDILDLIAFDQPMPLEDPKKPLP
jgi:hypothetical protein